MNTQEYEWAIDIVNDIYAEGDPLFTLQFARKALVDYGITDRRVIANVLARSLYSNDGRLNLSDTLALF